MKINKHLQNKNQTQGSKYLVIPDDEISESESEDQDEKDDDNTDNNHDMSQLFSQL